MTHQMQAETQNDVVVHPITVSSIPNTASAVLNIASHVIGHVTLITTLDVKCHACYCGSGILISICVRPSSNAKATTRVT